MPPAAAKDEWIEQIVGQFECTMFSSGRNLAVELRLGIGEAGPGDAFREVDIDQRHRSAGLEKRFLHRSICISQIQAN